ncbi:MULTISPECIES: phosphate signaling complex protein PhoU [Spiribacter]|uniref:Phosphate-specific transport system accessory protein PhoU n=1 Tax=Spiribacter roseus TaxID=1855875 RepID=A0ABV3RVP3_9GAMM|nr:MULTISPECIES: phosphate signaling complex protein PhoU [Spiribacter]AUB78803.1 phosphate transport system regulatory protein PhoU [Spiribacter roseus]KAF0284361.1 phosphate transport system regulatory protein PhoU [Spiribacter roseus]KAF0285347.1 phosphate transport system regulatory protein PhoU [Spiribacter sp. SSL99]PZA00161.1 phosphate transport system regulatory protein PhoU [Gammaproteobacteria bacterium 2W06]
MDKKTFTQHISQQYNEDLERIVTRVMTMGGLVEQQLEAALDALVNGDQEKGEQVVTSDYKINAMEVELDEACTHILARRQPTASDLRLIMAVIKAITDLERIGDEAERVGRMALHLLDEDRRRSPMAEIAALGEQIKGILRGALDAFARMDSEQAVRVAQEDIKADAQYDSIIRNLVKHLEDNPKSVPPVLDIVWATRSLERIGDRSRNICEYVIYFVRGKDVRHISFEQMAEEATGDRR